MRIRRRSVMTGKVHTREIAVTQGQINAWQNGAFIQDAMPDLSADDREFILSGTTPEEWAEAFPPDLEEPANFIAGPDDTEELT